MPGAGLRGFLYALFALSGFAGLIYESIWTHYLKLFLGHAAYAQTLVLAIFMGGMALGAWLAAERSRRSRRPLVAYAVVEGILGVAALGFDPVFRALQGWAFDTAIPALPGPLAIDLFKWTLASALILPQCVLLGTTFPLMSAGVVRLAPQQPGRVLGWLYFTNSLGASAGVLASGFVLVAAVGLPGTLLTAGILNLLIVLALWLVLPRAAAAAEPGVPAEPAAAGAVPVAHVDAAERWTDPYFRLLLATAFLTGAASFFYEIGWIRMLSLVLGAATHSFEFMLSAFILGLALGSFWIRRRIDHFADPLSALGWIQAAMALCALLSIVVYRETFGWMATFLEGIRNSDAGYVLFNLFSHGLCLLLMLPVTICAGMTLPLITAMLLRAGAGERAIGRVYAVNTAGAIVGVLLAVHLVMPLLGLRQVIVVGAAIDLGLGLWLLTRRRALSALERAAAATALVVAGVITAFVHFDPAWLGSGVYRYGRTQLGSEVLYHRDGKTASVDVLRDGIGAVSISTNGKVDAAYWTGGPSEDDYTMVLLGAVPVTLHPDPKQVAVIGFGSGRTTHALLHDPRVEAVHTIEIEPAMVEGARHFGDAVARAYGDPRSHIHYEDAKTFFSRQRARYDVIISEPSNPWVSGVASLFSTEFYAQARRHLAPGGLFVQWLQLYDIDESLIATVMVALDGAFGDYQIYGTADADLMIVARADGPVPTLTAQGYDAIGPALRRLLNAVEVRSLADLQAHRIGGKAQLAPLFASYGMPANSDYFPILDQHAVRHRFLESDARHLAYLQPYARRLEQAADEPMPSYTSAYWPRAQRARIASLRDYFQWRRAGGPPPPAVAGAVREVVALEAMDGRCGGRDFELMWIAHLRSLTERFGAYLSRDDARLIARDLRSRRCYAGASAGLTAWVDLLAAIGAGDHHAVREIAPALLKGLGEMREPMPEWVVMELLLADLAVGDGQAAERHLQRLGPGAPLTLPMKLVRAHTLRLPGEIR